MKIPLITRQVNVPASFHQPQESGAIALAARGVARAVDQVGDAAMRAVDAHNEPERERLRQERATDTVRALSTVASQMDTAELELQYGRKGGLTGDEIIEPPATHKDYLVKWADRWDKVSKGVLEGIQNQEVRRGAELLIERERIGRESRAKIHSARLWQDNEVAALNDLEERAVRETVLNPDPVSAKEWQDTYLGQVALKQGGNVISAVDAEQRSKRFHEKVALAQADRAIREGSFNSAEYADRVSPIQLGALVARDVQERERREEQVRTQRARMVDEAFGEYYAAARQGQVTAPEFEKDNEHLKFNAAQQKAVLDAIANRDVEDDPLVVKEVRLRSRRADLSQADVDWLAEQYAPSDGSAGRISGRTFEHWNAVYTQTARSNDALKRADAAQARAEATQARAEARELRAQASAERAEARFARAEERERERDRKEQEREGMRFLERGLHVGSELDRLTGAGTAAFTLASDEFTRRVRNGEDPDAVARQVLPKYITSIPETARKRIETIRASAPVQSLEELGPPEVAMPKFNLTREAYNQVVRQLLEAEQIEQRLADIAASRQAKTAETERRSREADTAARAQRSQMRSGGVLETP